MNLIPERITRRLWPEDADELLADASGSSKPGKSLIDVRCWGEA